MRISDWSSDVCSSDLGGCDPDPGGCSGECAFRFADIGPATDEGGAVADGQRLPDCRDNGAFIELCRIISRRPAEQDGEAVKSSLTAAFKRGHGGFQLCKEGPGPGCVERCVEACTHTALGKRQALSLKIDRAGRDRNPRTGSTRIAVCDDDI